MAKRIVIAIVVGEIPLFHFDDEKMMAEDAIAQAQKREVGPSEIMAALATAMKTNNVEQRWQIEDFVVDDDD